MHGNEFAEVGNAADAEDDGAVAEVVEFFVCELLGKVAKLLVGRGK